MKSTVFPLKILCEIVKILSKFTYWSSAHLKSGKALCTCLICKFLRKFLKLKSDATGLKLSIAIRLKMVKLVHISNIQYVPQELTCVPQHN